MRLKLVKALLTLITTSSLCFLVYTSSKDTEMLVINDARESFVKIIVENEIIVTACSEQDLFSDNCDLSSISTEGYQIFGSGVIIKHNRQNYILTADHICRQMVDGGVVSPDGRTGMLLSSPFAMTLDGMLHKVDIEKQDEILKNTF